MTTENDWRKDMPFCVVVPGECLANTPEACVCRQMPAQVYNAEWERLHKPPFIVGQH